MLRLLTFLAVPAVALAALGDRDPTWGGPAPPQDRMRLVHALNPHRRLVTAHGPGGTHWPSPGVCPSSGLCDMLSLQEHTSEWSATSHYYYDVSSSSIGVISSRPVVPFGHDITPCNPFPSPISHLCLALPRCTDCSDCTAYEHSG
eukprot:COSAG06_NODE_3667_length_5042_cov_2.098321_1_plen_146_part_00